MERPSRKRPFFEDDFGDETASRPTKQKKIRFPKGKKVKPEDAVAIPSKVDIEDDSIDVTDPRFAAKERAKRRSQLTAEIFGGQENVMGAAEVSYEDNDSFVEGGIQIEPFNLEKEREEGYFDAQGNFVEYVNENDFKDPWLDSVEVGQKYNGQSVQEPMMEDSDADNPDELSSDDIGKIKRRIANILEHGETVLQALRRLKGGSDKKKQKMSAETKLLFDQLTEDGNKLLDQGDYDVYQEKQEVFRREAEGYEKLALAKENGAPISSHQVASDDDIFADAPDHGASSSVPSNPGSGPSEPHLPSGETSADGADEFDMFADDYDTATAKSSINDGSIPGPNGNTVGQPSVDIASETVENDYVYDGTSGYYYSSSSGYYYDPSTGLYCHHAMSHQGNGTPTTKRLALTKKSSRAYMRVEGEVFFFW